MTDAHASTQPAGAVRGSSGATQELARYSQQRISWGTCRTGPADKVGAALDTAGAQCGTVTVPVDYREPAGRTLTVAISRRKATDPAHRRGILLINPGGPGAPGLEQVLLAPYLPAVAARYDLIGMDPRFTGRSTPLGCQWHTDTFLRSAGPDRASFEQSADLARELAASCAPGNAGLLPHASTLNTARDMDLIRAVLGEEKLSYFGVSYGTYLGALYLQLFGARADRIVLDGAVDPAAAGPGLFVPQAPALSAAFAHWAAWTAARDSTYGLGATAEQIRATVGRIIRVTNRRSLVLGPFRVDAHVLPLLLARQLGDDSDSSYATLATDVRTLSAAAQGTPAEPSDALHEFLTDLFTGSGPATDRAGTPILCADRAVSRDPETYYRDIQAHRGTEPLFGPLTRNITPCAYWAVTPAEPPVTVRNKVPVLIVGAGGDPLTPYPGQQAMHRALTRSRLVTLQGAYRHGVYLAAASPCIDQAVTRYLTSGALPPGDAACIPQPGTAAR